MPSAGAAAAAAAGVGAAASTEGPAMRSSVATMMPPRSRACLVTVRTYAERERFMQRRQQLEQQHAAQVSVGLALSAARERGLRVERDRQDAQEAEREVTRLVRRNGPRHPPPPLPAASPQPDEEAAVAESAASPASVTASLVPPPPAFTSVTLTSPVSTPTAKVTAKPPLPATAAPVVNGVASRVNGVARPASPSNAATNGVARVNGVTARPASPSNVITNGVARVNGARPASPANGVTTNAVAKMNGARPASPVNANGVARVNGASSPSVVTNGVTKVYGANGTSSAATAVVATNGVSSIQQARLRPVQHQQLQAQRLTHRTPSPAPHCPTPDYDSDSSGSTLHTASTAWTAKAVPPAPGAAGPAVVPEVEMQSLDSLELLEPRTKQPRPPQTYFQQNRGAPAARPSVSVTIREYGGGNSRQPSKLTFLNGGGAANGGANGTVPQVELQSELAATLSRSNLRSRTEVSEDASEAPKALDEVNRGNITVTSVNGTSSYLPKSTVPNGILKKAPVTHAVPNGLPIGHGITPAILAGAGAALKTKSSGISTKTITFGAKATIINEKQVST